MELLNSFGLTIAVLAGLVLMASGVILPLMDDADGRRIESKENQ